jgi:hypothetical protein
MVVIVIMFVTVVTFVIIVMVVTFVIIVMVVSCFNIFNGCKLKTKSSC